MLLFFFSPFFAVRSVPLRPVTTSFCRFIYIFLILKAKALRYPVKQCSVVLSGLQDQTKSFPCNSQIHASKIYNYVKSDVIFTEVISRFIDTFLSAKHGLPIYLPLSQCEKTIFSEYFWSYDHHVLRTDQNNFPPLEYNSILGAL